MDNECNSDNPLLKDVDREALLRAKFHKFQQLTQEFRQTTQQVLRQLLEMMECMQMGPIHSHTENPTHDEDGIQVRHIHHQ
jgi:hypothetical protein